MNGQPRNTPAKACPPPVPGMVPAQLRWAPPLVVDFDAVLSGDLVSGAPSEIGIARGALDLIRLQRRFRARVLLLSVVSSEMVNWAADVLGLSRALQRVDPERGPQAMTEAALAQYEPGWFVFLGGRESVAAVAGRSRRLWMLGRDPDLQRRMRTCGVPMIQAAPGPVVMFSDLRPRTAIGWPRAGDIAVRDPVRPEMRRPSRDASGAVH